MVVNGWLYGWQGSTKAFLIIWRDLKVWSVLQYATWCGDTNTNVCRRGSQSSIADLQGDWLIKLSTPPVNISSNNSSIYPIYVVSLLPVRSHPWVVRMPKDELSPDTKPGGTMLCTRKIRYIKSGYVSQFEALKKLVHPNEVKNIKMTLASPEWLHLHHGMRLYLSNTLTFWWNSRW